MNTSNSTRAREALAAVALAAVLAGCQTLPQSPDDRLVAAPQQAVTGNAESPFSVGLVPDTAPPIPLGAPLGFRLSASAPVYGHLYLINASGNVLVLAENLPLSPGREAIYPAPADGVTLRANPPAGTERVIMLATRQPFAGFSGAGGATVTRPAALPKEAAAFIHALNQATAALPESQWALTETRVRIYRR